MAILQQLNGRNLTQLGEVRPAAGIFAASSIIFDISFNQANFDGTKFLDASGNGNHATLTGTPAWDGSNDMIFNSTGTNYATLPIGMDAVSGTDFAGYMSLNVTFSFNSTFWITLDPQTNAGGFGHLLPGGNAAIRSSYYRTIANIAGGTHGTVFPTGVDASEVFSKNGSNYTIKSAGVAQVVAQAGSGFYAIAAPIIIGARANGVIRNATMWDRGLSVGEIAAL